MPTWSRTGLPLMAATVEASADARGLHAAQLLLQLLDLVAQPCRQLELQVAGRVVHLVGQLLDEIGELGARHAGEVLGVPARVAALRAHAGHRRLAARLGAPGAAVLTLGALADQAV